MLWELKLSTKKAREGREEWKEERRKEIIPFKYTRTASKHVHYLGWNRSPAQVGCMRQVLGPGALGRPRGMGWRGRWEGGSGWGTHVNPWLIHISVWQNPLQYCKVISLQLIEINEKKKKKVKSIKYTGILILPVFLPYHSSNPLVSIDHCLDKAPHICCHRLNSVWVFWV